MIVVNAALVPHVVAGGEIKLRPATPPRQPAQPSCSKLPTVSTPMHRANSYLSIWRRCVYISPIERSRWPAMTPPILESIPLQYTICRGMDDAGMPAADPWRKLECASGFFPQRLPSGAPSSWPLVGSGILILQNFAFSLDFTIVAFLMDSLIMKTFKWIG